MATRQSLIDLFSRKSNQPTLLFTASHGLGYESAHPLQMKTQGALVCQDWPGSDVWPKNREIPETMYLAGHHLHDMRFDGLVVFAFACFGAGTPHYEEFACYKYRKPKDLSPYPFIAELPKRMLAQGALAFIGHIDRTWEFSFLSDDAGNQIDTFQSTLEAVLKGYPLGLAFEHFNSLYVNLTRELTMSYEQSLLYKYNIGEPVDIMEIVDLWTARNDARGYIILGDPFVHINPTRLGYAASDTET